MSFLRPVSPPSILKFRPTRRLPPSSRGTQSTQTRLTGRNRYTCKSKPQRMIYPPFFFLGLLIYLPLEPPIKRSRFLFCSRSGFPMELIPTSYTLWLPSDSAYSLFARTPSLILTFFFFFIPNQLSAYLLGCRPLGGANLLVPPFQTYRHEFSSLLGGSFCFPLTFFAKSRHLYAPMMLNPLSYPLFANFFILDYHTAR